MKIARRLFLPPTTTNEALVALPALSAGAIGSIATLVSVAKDSCQSPLIPVAVTTHAPLALTDVDSFNFTYVEPGYQQIERSTPPSTRNAAPVVADACSDAT